MADRLTAAKARLAELLEKHPEMRPYTLPATAGDMDAIGKKLDGIVELLQRIANEQARIAEALARRTAGEAERAPFPEAGQVEVEHIPGVVTTIRATLQPGMSLTLPPMPDEDGGRETHRKLGRLLTGQRKALGMMKRFVANGSA